MPIVELHQDRSLVNSNFDGYKLSLEPVPVIRAELSVLPVKMVPNNEQYSLLHAEIFSMQNLLCVDPWARTIAYFVDQQYRIICSYYNTNTGRNLSLQTVYTMIANKTERQSGDYNFSMRFISEKYCILCDGATTLYLLDTGDRCKRADWKLIASTTMNTARGLIIYDARLDIIKCQKQISIAVANVARKVSEGEVYHHYMQIFWCTWLQTDTTWHFELCETLESKGSIYYCAFEPRAVSLIVSSNREILMQTQKVRKVEEKERLKMEKPQLHSGSGDTFSYTWKQNDDDIILQFEKQEPCDRNKYNIKCTETTVNVKYLDATLLDGLLHDQIDNDLTTWTVENDFIQLTLVKKETGEFWPTLLKQAACPLEDKNESGPNTESMEKAPIVNLETPIEDCDFPIEALEMDENKIERFNLDVKDVTHTVMLGSVPILFETNLRPGFPNAFVTRQDVDASLWLQHYNPEKPNVWNIRHEGNLDAFGYIQASKQQRKYIDCAPDLSYSIIAETHRHIFLYKAKHDAANGLRNRHGPQITVGKQLMVTIDDELGEVLGMCTDINVVTLLTERAVLYLQI